MKNNFYFLLISCATLSMVHAKELGQNVEPTHSKVSKECELLDCRVLSTPKVLKNDGLSLIEVDYEIDLGFDPYLFLSPDFDPYFGMELNIDSLIVMEDEVEVDLGFDTSLYLPKDFNPYLGM